MRKISKIAAKLKLFGKKLLGFRRRWNYSNGRIRHEQKIIFVHIPKTAGNSITKALSEVDNVPNKKRKKSPKIAKHAKAFEVRYLLGEDIWEDYFTFSFVRNPWDLMVSSYKWWRQKAANRVKRYANVARKIQSMDFQEFVNSKYGKYMINERYGNFFDWLSNGEEIMVDFVGKVENINEDWAKICEINNLDHIEMPHENKTDRVSYRDYYNDETRQMVAKRFQKSIKYFDYSF